MQNNKQIIVLLIGSLVFRRLSFPRSISSMQGSLHVRLLPESVDLYNDLSSPSYMSFSLLQFTLITIVSRPKTYTINNDHLQLSSLSYKKNNLHAVCINHVSILCIYLLLLILHFQFCLKQEIIKFQSLGVGEFAMNLKNIYTNPTSIAWGGFTGRIDLAFGTKNNVWKF